jgi:Ca2+-binding EF-hand superfamily protein
MKFKESFSERVFRRAPRGLSLTSSTLQQRRQQQPRSLHIIVCKRLFFMSHFVALCLIGSISVSSCNVVSFTCILIVASDLMGSGASLPSLTASSALPPDDAIKYAKRYQMKPDELRFIFRRFCVLCKTNGRTLVPGDVSRAASLIGRDLSKRIISVMAARSRGGIVDFDTFLQTYRKFRHGQPLDSKLQFAFDVFDRDGDGRSALSRVPAGTVARAFSV